MNLTTEAVHLIKGYESGALGSKVRIVVGAVEQVVHTAFFGDGSKESSHKYFFSG
jgi:hypothetical protein